MRATLTTKGQLTIPKEIRDYLEVRPGDRLDFQIRDGGQVVVEAHNLDLLSLRGILKDKYKGPSKTLEEMEEGIRQGASQSYRPRRSRR